MILSDFCSINLFSVVPHITDAIQEWVMKQAKVSVDDDGVEPQVCVIEVKWSWVVIPYPFLIHPLTASSYGEVLEAVLCK